MQADGTIALTGSGLKIAPESGTTIASGTLDVSNHSSETPSTQTITLVDALSSGNGGRVVIWADETTAFSGTIQAGGGPHFCDSARVM